MTPSQRHPDQIRWNEKYAATGPAAFEREPSDWLVQHEALLAAQPKGPALDVAAGNGRNAFYLARLSFMVDALDISDVAIAWLEAEARRRRLDVRPRWVNLETEPLPKEKYQVIVNVNYLERRIFAALVAALVPGGLLLFETMTVDELNLPDRKFDRRFLLEQGELLRAFPDLGVIEHHEGIVGNSSGPKRAVARLVARK